jgi:hypothetical protein
MNTLLLVITAVSLVVAGVSATVAFRVTRADRRRRQDRVAALAAAAGVADAAWVPNDPASAPATTAADAPLSTALDPEVVVAADRFLVADASGSGSATRQYWLMGVATFATALLVTVAAASFVSVRHPRTTEVTDGVAPLELVALAHGRTGGALTVSGLVRNPAAGARVDRLEAEVRVFDPAGILIATRAAQVDYVELAPGQESPFAVALGEATTAARYRVSFRASGTMRPHVDHRTNAPASVHRAAEAR